jgi:hypothetical protein
MRSRWRVLYRSAQPMSALPKSQPVRSRRADVGQGQRPVYRCTSPHAILDWETHARWLSPQGHSVFGPVRDGSRISGEGLRVRDGALRDCARPTPSFSTGPARRSGASLRSQGEEESTTPTALKDFRAGNRNDYRLGNLRVRIAVREESLAQRAASAQELPVVQRLSAARLPHLSVLHGIPWQRRDCLCQGQTQQPQSSRLTLFLTPCLVTCKISRTISAVK